MSLNVAFGNSRKLAAEKNLAGADRLGRGRRAVNQIGRGLGQRLVRDARAGIFRLLLFQRRNFLLRQKREEFQIADHVAVIHVDPELVEAIDARLFRIEPDRAGGGLAKLGSVRLRDERQRQAIALFVQLLVHAGQCRR
jgi:hypothetical protein